MENEEFKKEQTEPTPEPTEPTPEPIEPTPEPTEPSTVPASTVEALKSAYESKLKVQAAEYEQKIAAQDEVIRGIFGNGQPLKKTNYMEELVAAHNEKWARRKF